MLIPKNKPIRSKAHLSFIKKLPCVTCFKCAPNDASHISKGNGKGVARKVGDDFTVPQCRQCHEKLHNVGEVTFWYDYGGHEKAAALGKELYSVTGDTIEGMKRIIQWKRST